MYLDPGFGGMLLQVIVAIVAAGGAILFSFRRKISALFSGNKNNDNTSKAVLSVQSANASNVEAEDIIDVMEDK